MGTLTYKSGSLTQRIKSKEYIYARIPMPKEIKSALRKLKSRKYSDAVRELDSAYNKYRFLGWDIFCIYYAGAALEKDGKIDRAITKLKMLNTYPKDPEKIRDYDKAKKLLATLYITKSDFDEAEKILAAIGQADDPEIFAFVNNSRGDILAKKGKNKDAVIMYMRTVMFSTKENNKKERPEAIAKVVKLLKEEKNNRYLDFEKILKAEYPGYSL